MCHADREWTLLDCGISVWLSCELYFLESFFLLGSILEVKSKKGTLLQVWKELSLKQGNFIEIQW